MMEQLLEIALGKRSRKTWANDAVVRVEQLEPRIMPTRFFYTGLGNTANQ